MGPQPNTDAINRELVLETYPDAPIGSLDLILDPVHMKEIAKCGVAFLDSPTDIIPTTLAHLGLPPDSTNRKDYAKVKDTLLAIRPYIKTFDNYAYQRMPQREFCVAFTWGPDGLLAMADAAEANTGVVLDFFLRAGDGKAQLWIDGWVIPADAKNCGGGAQVPRLHDASRGRGRGLQLHLVRHGERAGPRHGRLGSDGQPGVVSPAGSGGPDVYAGSTAEEGGTSRHPGLDDARAGQ